MAKVTEDGVEQFSFHVGALFLASYFVMLYLGILHHSGWQLVPAFGYWASLALVALPSIFIFYWRRSWKAVR